MSVVKGIAIAGVWIAVVIICHSTNTKVEVSSIVGIAALATAIIAIFG